jgi:exodeoxyribonuclease VII large subunit
MAPDFFEFREKMTARPRAAAQPPIPSDPSGAISVTDLTNRIDRVLKENFAESLLVRGELSNFSRNAASGHLYFTLKDAQSCIDCVMWKSDAIRLKFAPTEGMELIVTGRLSVYGKRGKYQCYATSLRPLGQGALELAFQQMRAKLTAEGLFDVKRKRPLPAYPLTIVLVTSREAAGLQDVLKVLRRFPWVKLKLYAVPVQGDGAAQKIAAALDHLSSTPADAGADVILLARGGGSLEDLWAFNEEAVARAIVASRIPVITGIGHEVDVSIADLVADYHAHTPTEAAQVVSANWRDVPVTLETQAVRLNRALRAQVQDARQVLAAIERHEVFRRPFELINLRRQILDDRQRGITMALQNRLRAAEQRLGVVSAGLEARHPRMLIELRRQETTGLAGRLGRSQESLTQRWKQRIDAIDAQLQALSPAAVLRRGYSMTTRADGKLIRSVGDVRQGDRLLTRLSDGVIKSIAQNSAQLELFEPSGGEEA